MDTRAKPRGAGRQEEPVVVPGARVKLAVTLGDPRGIGPEIVAKALGDERLPHSVELIVVGPSGCGVAVHQSIGHWSADVGASERVENSALAGRLAGLAIERAVALVKSGAADGIVTAPIDKAALLAGGYDFPGHTEMLARLAGVPTTMMLASDKLRVVLATTHIALRDVPRAVTAGAIAQAAHGTRHGLQRWFGIAQPRLAL